MLFGKYFFETQAWKIRGGELQLRELLLAMEQDNFVSRMKKCSSVFPINCLPIAIWLPSYCFIQYTESRAPDS